MSKIIYKPHCEKCGSLIDQKIQITRIVSKVGDHTPCLYGSTYYEFNPCRCENCGAIFDSAEFQPPEEMTQFLD